MIRPSLWGGTSMDIEVIWVRREPKYFCKWGWTVNQSPCRLICPAGKSTELSATTA
jgi:hypothetical protein